MTIPLARLPSVEESSLASPNPTASAASAPAPEIPLRVFESADGSVHVGSEPPPGSLEIGRIDGQAARSLAHLRAGTPASASAADPLEVLRRRLRMDTSGLAPASHGGDPSWTWRDVRVLDHSGGRLDVATDWITNETMLRVAARMCRYFSAQGDAFRGSEVVVRGRGGRILSRCHVWL